MILTLKQGCLPVQQFSTGLPKEENCVLCAVETESLCKNKLI
jgi:hypothetical protein